MDPESLLRPHVRGLAPYVPILPFEALSRKLGRAPDTLLKLDANENPYGPLPAVLNALRTYPYYHIYPDPQQAELREALAGQLGIPSAQILPTHGADEMIDLLCRLFLGPEDCVLNCPPTFGMYEFDAALQGAHVVEIPRLANFAVDVDAIEERARSTGWPGRERAQAALPDLTEQPIGQSAARCRAAPAACAAPYRCPRRGLY